jgi:hypothetical protein
MEAQQLNIAVARGEAIAANLLASAALQALFAIVIKKEETLSGIAAFIDDSLNMSGPSKGDANDEINTHMREIARLRAMETLDAIRRGLK